MKEKEAIERIRDHFRIHDDGRPTPYLDEAVRMAISTLNKQEPKKPIYSDYEDDGYGEMIPYRASCPTCGGEFEFGTWNGEDSHHCACGQRIDWSR